MVALRTSLILAFFTLGVASATYAAPTSYPNAEVFLGRREAENEFVRARGYNDNGLDARDLEESYELRGRYFDDDELHVRGLQEHLDWAKAFVNRMPLPAAKNKERWWDIYDMAERGRAQELTDKFNGGDQLPVHWNKHNRRRDLAGFKEY